MSVKIAVLAPIPSARDNTATVVKTTDFRKLRTLMTTSRSKRRILPLLLAREKVTKSHRSFAVAAPPRCLRPDPEPRPPGSGLPAPPRYDECVWPRRLPRWAPQALGYSL